MWFTSKLRKKNGINPKILKIMMKLSSKENLVVLLSFFLGSSGQSISN